MARVRASAKGYVRDVCFKFFSCVGFFRAAFICLGAVGHASIRVPEEWAPRLSSYAVLNLPWIPKACCKAGAEHLHTTQCHMLTRKPEAFKTSDCRVCFYCEPRNPRTSRPLSSKSLVHTRTKPAHSSNMCKYSISSLHTCARCTFQRAPLQTTPGPLANTISAKPCKSPSRSLHEQAGTPQTLSQRETYPIYLICPIYLSSWRC